MMLLRLKTLAKENKFSCDFWQIDLNSATPNHVSLDNGRGGYIRWRTNPLILQPLAANRGHQKNQWFHRSLVYSIMMLNK